MEGVTVAEILTLPALQGAQVVAGHAGLDRRVRGVNVMEVPDIADFVAPGELLLTTAYPVRDRPELLVDLLPVLHAKGLAGLAIKPLRYLARLPEGLADEADRLSFPLIVVADDTSFNHVIGAVLAVVLAEYGAEPARAEAIRERLTGVALSGGGLDEIARTLSGAVQQDVAILAPADEVLGRSRVGLTDEEAGSLPWHFQITVAGARRGRISVGGAAEPTLGQRRLIRQACFASAMHLAQAMAALDLDRRLRVLFLEEIVTGPAPDPEVIHLRSRLFGWDLAGSRAVAIARCRNDLADSDAAATVERAFGPRAITWTRGHEVLAIVPAAEATGDEQRLARWCDELLQRGAHDVTVALGEPVTSAEELRTSHASARSALRIGQLTGQRIVRQDTVAVERLLLELPADALAAFVAEQIGPLLDCDAREGGHLCSTLEVYLGVGNGAEAARRLFVHYNTLKHRLARISALLDTDLRDPRRRAALTLALAGRHLGSPVPARGRT